MAFYPLFCAWIQEMLPCATSAQEAYLAMDKRLKPIIISALARRAHFYDIDIDDCRDEVFSRMERKLGEPMEFNVKLAQRGASPVSRIVSVFPGEVHASFLFEVFETNSTRLGYKVRLRTADRLVWEEDCPAEQIDSRTGTLPVKVPASKLDHGQSYSLQLESASSGGRVATQEFHTVHIRALHLLRTDSFTIVGHHVNLDPLQKYHAEFRDTSENVLVKIGPLPCSEKKTVPVSLRYEQLRHEEDTHMELAREETPELGYFACVRAVRYEALRNRMGFVVQVARNVVSEHSGRAGKLRKESLESLPQQDHPLAADKGQDTTVLLAKRAIERLPKHERSLLIEHELRGRSWTEIAQRHGLSEAKVKQDVSRALKKATEAIRAGGPEADKAAIRRFVDWIKEMLPDVFRNAEQ